MNWIDSNVAVGSLEDKYRARIGDVFVVDVRDAFKTVISTIAISPSIITTYPIRGLVLELAENIANYARRGKKVLIHCRAGIDRGPFIAVLYRMNRYYETFEEAYAMVVKAHPQTIEHWEWREYAKDTVF